MPNCICFYRNGEKEATTLNKIDEEICGLFGAEVHPTRYYNFWFDVIGFHLAMGKTYEEIAVGFLDSIKNILGEKINWTDSALDYGKYMVMVAYLRENYKTKAWYERK